MNELYDVSLVGGPLDGQKQKARVGSIYLWIALYGDQRSWIGGPTTDAALYREDGANYIFVRRASEEKV